MRRIYTTEEAFKDKEPEIIEKGKTMLHEPKAGVKQRMRGIGETPKFKTPKTPSLDLENLTLVSLPPETELDILNTKIEETYTEYLKLHEKIEGFDTSLSEIPDSMKPTIVANHNKMIEKHNSLLGVLQDNIAKRDKLYAIQKRQEFLKKNVVETAREEPEYATLAESGAGWEHRMAGMGELPGRVKVPVSKSDESDIKDVADAFVLGGSRIWQQTKDYFLNALPNNIFAPLKPTQKYIHGIEITEEIRKKLNAKNKERIEYYDKGYARSQADYYKWLKDNPQLQPRKEWADGVVKSVKKNPEILLDPAYWAYVASDSAAFTVGVMGTTLAVTAITQNPLIGMAAGVIVATPMQTQDLYEDLIANGATPEHAGKLAAPVGALIASVEVMGDLPILANLSKPFKKMLFGNIRNTVVARVAQAISRSKAVNFATIEFSETLEEVVQAAIQDACVKTVNENRKILGDLKEIVTATPMATLPFAMLGISADVNTQDRIKNQIKAKVDKLINDRNLRDAIKIQLEEQGIIPREEIVTEAYKTEEEIKAEELKAKPKEPTTPEELEPLAEEARKYESAEEFGESFRSTYVDEELTYENALHQVHQFNNPKYRYRLLLSLRADSKALEKIEKIQSELRKKYGDTITLWRDAKGKEIKELSSWSEVERGQKREVPIENIVASYQTNEELQARIEEKEYIITSIPVQEFIKKIPYFDSLQDFYKKTEPKPPITPEELEAKREMLREHGVKEELLTDEFVKKATIKVLEKADVTTEKISEKLIEDLEEKWGKETELTKEKVLEKVEKPPKVEPKELGEKFVGKAFRAETEIPEHGAEIITKMKTAQEKLDYDYGTTGNEIFKNAEKIAKESGLDLKKVPIKEIVWVAPDLETAEKYGKAKEIKLTEDTMILAKDEEGGFLVLKNVDKYKTKPKAPKEIEVGKEIKEKIAPELKKVIEIKKETEKAQIKLIDEKVSELKEEGFKGVEKGGVRRDEEGYVIGKFGAVSKNPRWYRDFYKTNKKRPNISDLKEIAEKQLSKGHEEDYGIVPPSEIYQKLDSQIESYDTIIETLKKEIPPIKKEEPPKPPKPTTFAEPEEEPKFRKDVKVKDVCEEKITKIKEKSELKIEKLKGKYEERIKHLKGKAKERLEKRIKKLKEHFEEVKRKARERKAQKKYIDKLIKDINKLPTNNMDLRYKDRIEVIKDMFDLKKRRQKTLHAREETAKFIEREMAKGTTDLKIPQSTIDLIGKVPLNDMTITELEIIHDDLISLAHIGQTKDRMIKLNEKRTVEETIDLFVGTIYKGDQLTKSEIAEIKERKIAHEIQIYPESVMKGIKKLSPDKLKDLRNQRTLKDKFKDTWNTYFVNTKLDESLFEEIDGHKKGVIWEFFYKSLNDAYNEELTGHWGKADRFWEFLQDAKIDITKFITTKVEAGGWTLTPAKRAGIYLCSLDEDARRHLQKSKNMSDKDIETIVASMTDEEKSVAEYYKNYQLTQADELDVVEIDVRKRHLKRVKNRFGVQVLNEELNNTEIMDIEYIDPGKRRAYLGEGFLKERTKWASNALNIDCISNMLRDWGKVEHYKAYIKPTRDINKVITDPRFKEAIERTKGKIVYQNINKWFKDAVDAKQGKRLATADSVLMFLRTNAAISMLGLNVISSMRQLVSLSNAIAEAGLPAILSGIEQVSLNYHEVKQFAYKLDPQVKYRFGQIEPSLREMMEGKEIQRHLSGKPGLKKQMLFLIRKFDEFAVLSVWKGSYDSAINKGKSQQEAIDYASAVMRKTQPMVAAKDLPQWFRDGMVVKLFNMFQNQINKNWNYINHDIFGKLKHGQISPYTAAHRLLFGWFLPSVLLGMISRGRRPKDWKEIATDMAVYYAGGLFFFGAFAVNAIKGYGGYVTPVLAFGTDIVKSMTYKTTESKIKAGISASCKVLGIPYNQPYRTIEGIEDLWLEETDNIRRLIWSKYVLGKEEEKPSFEKVKIKKVKKAKKKKKKKKF